MAEEKRKLTNHDFIMERLNTIVSRLDETNSRIDSTNTRLDVTNERLDNVKKDLSIKIDALKTDFDSQFQNHLSEHANFRKNILKIIKWGVCPTGGAGIVLAVLKGFGVF